MPHKPAGWGIAAVIVTFNPSREFADNLDRIAGQFDATYVVDNGSACVDNVRGASCIPRVSLIELQENIGIAEALNIGIKRALDTRVQYITTFDQDTVVDSGFSEVVTTWMRRSTGRAILGVNFRTPDGRCVYRGGDGCERVTAVITSGCTYHRDVFTRGFWFENSMFIDLVDIEHCFRCGKAGLPVERLQRPMMVHSIGNERRIGLLGLSFVTSNHSTVRRYYMYRNFIYVSAKYFLRHPTWVVFTALRRAKVLCLILAFEDHKWAKLGAVCRGLSDGVKWCLTGRRTNFHGLEKVRP